MKSLRISVLLTLVALSVANSFASTETVLYSFTGGLDGRNPSNAGVFARDSSGNLFGTTTRGGSGTFCGDQGCGTVYKLAPNPDGSWTETVVYSFQGIDGDQPPGGLILDSDGNIYGTTSGGGISGIGTVFKLSGSTLTSLYSFSGGSDGAVPTAGVVRDKRGNLFGTTYAGGLTNRGVVFEISPSGHFSVIHTFCTNSGCPDGANPYGGLIMDEDGSLLGTTGYGGHGTCACGTVFKLSKSGGEWKETLLHSFVGIDGANPFVASLTLGKIKTGNKTLPAIFGVTIDGGDSGYGTAFALVKATHGYALTVLYGFPQVGHEGYGPYGTLTYLKGKLYGTTVFGGDIGLGTAYELEHLKNGWKETLLYSFCSGGLGCPDGGTPSGGMLADASGNLYGVTSDGGGQAFSGVVYKVTP